MKNTLKKISFVLLLVCASPCLFAANHTQATENYLQSIANNPPALQIFMQAMPKGGDLHNHLMGAEYAENMLAFAPNDFYIDAHAQVSKQSYSRQHRANQIGAFNPHLFARVIDTWSMRGFHPGKQSGHDHFFASFAKFFPLGAAIRARMLANLANQAAREHLEYIEFMVSPDNGGAQKIAKSLSWQKNLLADEAALNQKGLGQEVKQANANLNHWISASRRLLQCQSQHPEPGCKVTLRFQYQVLRDFPKAQVFAQMLLGFRLASTNPNVVAVNIVQPEDGYYSLHDYTTHMQMFQFLSKQFPEVKKALHAGELTLPLVPSEALRFHIRQAVNIAGAERIGHGVDIAYETNPSQLLAELAKKHIMVEINLSSNAAILGVSGKQHPLHLYLAHHVPVALSTDDQGILRTDLTEQYKLAVTSQHLDYRTLKQLDRNSLTYSFLPGKSLWQTNGKVITACQNSELGGPTPKPACQKMLRASLKARLQWQLEAKLHQFEQNIVSVQG